MEPSDSPPGQRFNRPWLTAFLIAPAAVIAIGLVNGALSYLLRHEGIDPGNSSKIVSVLALPHTFFFLWTPITDFWLSRRNWLIASAAAAAAAIVLAFHQPMLGSAMGTRLIFLGFCLGMLVVSSCGGIMGTLAGDQSRRRASSFYQIGSLVFGGLAVFLLVRLSGRWPLAALGWMLAALIFLPAVTALAVPSSEPSSSESGRTTAAHIWVEFKATFLRKEAIPYILLIVFPMCSGSMIGLLPGLAADYGVSANQVAWMNGIAGALLTAAGSFSASLIPVRVRAPIAYLLAGLVNAASLILLALGPTRPLTYFAGTVLFLFTIGAGYALFTGVVLEFLGDSGKSGAARYSLINSLGNLPVAYMAYVDGLGYHRWGVHAVPATDAVVSAVAAALLLAVFLLRRRPAPQPVAV